MKVKELRSKFIQFFIKHGHKQITGASLLPDNDPTVLFNTAGMQPLVPYFLNEEHPEGRRLVDFQKCIRTGDIEEVGDESHLTFFEMLGNWSLGDYFKEEAISMSFEFLTNKDYLNIPLDRLYISVFAGDEDAPRDEDAVKYWLKQGIPKEHIFYFPKKQNWWGPAGMSGPCGPDTEIFYDTGKTACGATCDPSCSCGKYLEIWNNVFMQYNKTKEGKFEPLKKPCVDTGMGLERTACILQGLKSVYDLEVFEPLIEHIESLSGKKRDDTQEITRSMRIIADHVKASIFILGDERGVAPSNVGAGYVLRRLLRRAIRFAHKLSIEPANLVSFIPLVLQIYGSSYPELVKNQDFIKKEIKAEEERFSKTLAKGEAEFNKKLASFHKNPRKIIPGRNIFHLYDTYGFPLELAEELAYENGLSVDKLGFQKAFEKHQELSKQNMGQSFKGGLADNSEQVVKLHTATHLLHEALRRVLGEHVAQKGSNITSERLRFDFVQPRKLNMQELQQVEDMVNEQIKRCLPVSYIVTTVEEAKKRKARALFSDRYTEQIKLYSIGDFSLEVCGGPHVENTSKLGHFKILKEEAVSAGVRRIKATLY
ncbi:UNVERIFIED_CONTAM: hypothetical protein PYX00_011941 [Menopon gallinae]|uniref:alanine--tRNA ligase n=1 Tax=Menopon gallinae TaxID=328185 RepID=A0AAW2H9J9_9NEOP